MIWRVCMDCIRLEEAEFNISRDPNNVLETGSVLSLRRRIRGHHYRGHSEYHLIGSNKEDKEYFDKETSYRISSRPYFYEYIGHYSPEKYLKEMEDFKRGKRKSRPNGRIWHKVPVEHDQRKSWWYSPD